VRIKNKKGRSHQATGQKLKTQNMKQVSHHKQKIKSKQILNKRLIPKTYTLRAVKMLLLKYEFNNQNPRAWGFMAWLEKREKQQATADNRLYGIE